MRSASSRRRPGAQRTALLVLLGISVLGHAAVVATVQVNTPSMAGLLLPVPLPSKRCAGAACADLQPTCESDAALGAAARLGLCASPFAAGGSAACTHEAVRRLASELTRCEVDPDEVSVELVDLKDLDLQPRPLVPDVKPQDDVVAAQLIEKDVAEKIEQAQKEIQRPTVTGQVVEITRPNVEMVPDKARYLSDYDSKTDRQTVARGAIEKMVEHPGPRSLPPNAKTDPEQVQEQKPPSKPSETAETTADKAGQGRGKDTQPGLMSMRGPGQTSEVPREEPIKTGAKIGEKIATTDGIAPRWGERRTAPPTTTTTTTDLPQPAGGEQGGGAGAKPPDLRPSPQLLERAVGGGSVDNIDDADEGDVTSLNSRKWKYATFFNRMKLQVAQNWHPDQVYLRRDPNGNIYGSRDRLTVLRVSLTPNGSVAKIYVARQSGVDFLDDEAVRAFQEAQPFPNPPAALVDAHSNLITFSFGFHFQIGSDRSHWKVFRYQ